MAVSIDLGPFLGVRLLRIIIYWVLFWGALFMETLKQDLSNCLALESLLTADLQAHIDCFV